MKVVQHMETYWNILEKMRGSQLRLTKLDDEIHEHFKKEFPNFDPAATINEDEMKSKEGKERWRNFVNTYEKKVDDFNFGAMLRANAKTEYEKDGTIFGMPFVWDGVLFFAGLEILTSTSCSHAVLRRRDRSVCDF